MADILDQPERVTATLNRQPTLTHISRSR